MTTYKVLLMASATAVFAIAALTGGYTANITKSPNYASSNSAMREWVARDLPINCLLDWRIGETQERPVLGESMVQKHPKL